MPVPSSIRVAGSGTAVGVGVGVGAGVGVAVTAAETVPEMLDVKPCSVVPTMAAGWITLAKLKLSARGSPRSLLGSTLEVKLTDPGGSDAERVSDEPPVVPNTKSVKLAVR